MSKFKEPLYMKVFGLLSGLALLKPGNAMQAAGQKDCFTLASYPPIFLPGCTIEDVASEYGDLPFGPNKLVVDNIVGKLETDKDFLTRANATGSFDASACRMYTKDASNGVDITFASCLPSQIVDFVSTIPKKEPMLNVPEGKSNNSFVETEKQRAEEQKNVEEQLTKLATGRF